MKFTGLKKAVGEYNRANEGGIYSPRYGYLMYDMQTGEIWTDEFYSLGHNEWKEYHSDSIINLGAIMEREGVKISMKNVIAFLENMQMCCDEREWLQCIEGQSSSENLNPFFYGTGLNLLDAREVISFI